MVEDEQARQEAMERAAKARSMEEALEAAKADSDEKKPKNKKFNRRFPASKRHKNNLKARGDRRQRHSITDGIKQVKAGKAAKFDESMELHLKLGVDGKKADQQVRDRDIVAFFGRRRVATGIYEIGFAHATTLRPG